MRVFVAGATGAIGVPAVRQLVAAGHDVVGLTRTPGKTALVRALGAEPAVADALDPAGLRAAVVAAHPAVVVHLLTALPKNGPTRAADLRATEIVRARGTRNLRAAAVAAGARRLVVEGFVGVYGVGNLGARPLAEDELPARAEVMPRMQMAVESMRAFEQSVVGPAGHASEIEGVVLRLGYIYGPEVGSTQFMARLLRRRMFPLPGGGRGVVPWVHVEDAAAAFVAALTAGAPGAIYNVVDDEPVALRAYAEEFAGLLGAPPPWSVPLWLARLLAPYAAAGLSGQLVLANARAKRDLGWVPRYPTYRDGLRATVPVAD
ncbi:MAG: hypothetical protein QOF51_1896 [Chloroflexota bacterium]|nr:hypothetical protein [Chloroflexota bacterium]